MTMRIPKPMEIQWKLLHIPLKVMRNVPRAPTNFTKQRTKAVLGGYVQIFSVNPLGKHLAADAQSLIQILKKVGTWNPEKDAKLNALEKLLTQTHPDDKVLVFTQFADTVHYLKNTLSERGITQIAAATGDSANPTALAWRFSPISNNQRGNINTENELRVLISTDVLSEGQNLQDGSIVVNYDLPWAIIRLVQRAWQG